MTKRTTTVRLSPAMIFRYFFDARMRSSAQGIGVGTGVEAMRDGEPIAITFDHYDDSIPEGEVTAVFESLDILGGRAQRFVRFEPAQARAGSPTPTLADAIALTCEALKGYATGGVVNPGKFGLFGESAPESVMPSARSMLREISLASVVEPMRSRCVLGIDSGSIRIIEQHIDEKTGERVIDVVEAEPGEAGRKLAAELAPGAKIVQRTSPEKSQPAFVGRTDICSTEELSRAFAASDLETPERGFGSHETKPEKVEAPAAKVESPAPETLEHKGVHDAIAKATRDMSRP